MSRRSAKPWGPLELTGRSRLHVVELDAPPCTLHHEVRDPFLAMREAAARAGLELEPVSSFRDFDRQRAIWNAKYRGERPVLDARGRPVDVLALAPAARVTTILLWSALPGASRHHWGTDIDVIDRNALGAGQTVRLIPEEYAAGGPFARLSDWLERNMRRYGFYRPYVSGAGGVRPEPWHLSFAPLARQALARLDLATLADALGSAGVLGEEWILESLPAIHARYVRTVDKPPRMRSRWATGPR